MTFEDIVQEIPKLSFQQRKELITLLVDSLAPISTEAKTHSIFEFEGVGAKLRDMDAQEYVNKLREEWDHRP